MGANPHRGHRRHLRAQFNASQPHIYKLNQDDSITEYVNETVEVYSRSRFMATDLDFDGRPTVPDYLPSVDLKSEGGYVLAHPSHIGGKYYSWSVSLKAVAMAPFPPFLITLPKIHETTYSGEGENDRPLRFADGTRDNDLFYSYHILTSKCHPYGTGPAYLFMKYVLGIQALQPGYKRVMVKPQAMGLKLARGRLQTPAGEFEIYWRKST